MFSKILFATSATEASDHAARVAFNMALNHSAHLVIFHVIGVPARGSSHFIVDIKTDTQVEINDDYFEWVEEEIKVYYAKQIKGLKSYEIKIVIGSPPREILRIARKINPDVIVLGGSTDKESSYKKNIVGSTIHKVTKSANCPVLLVNRPAASFWGGISNIVFATNLSDKADIAFQFLLELVKHLKCEFHIFKTIDIEYGSLTQDEIDIKIRENLKIMHERYLPEIKAHGLDSYFFNVWEGTSYIEIVKYARESHADLIITAQGNAKSSALLGLKSNLEQMIVRSGCPVLIIKKEKSVV